MKRILKTTTSLYRLAKKIQALLSDAPYKSKLNLNIIDGKAVCLDMTPKFSTIISGGIGSDIVLERRLIKLKEVRIIGFGITDTVERYFNELKEKIIAIKAISDKSEYIKIYYGVDVKFTEKRTAE